MLYDERNVTGKVMMLNTGILNKYIMSTNPITEFCAKYVELPL